jgi:hypothetical protein
MPTPSAEQVETQTPIVTGVSFKIFNFLFGAVPNEAVNPSQRVRMTREKDTIKGLTCR